MNIDFEAFLKGEGKAGDPVVQGTGGDGEIIVFEETGSGCGRCITFGLKSTAGPERSALLPAAIAPIGGHDGKVRAGVVEQVPLIGCKLGLDGGGQAGRADQRQRLWLVEVTSHDVMIPHTIVLGRNLEVFKVYNGYYYWGRPSMAELHGDLRALGERTYSDWDITQPPLREKWENGDKSDSYPYGPKSISMETLMLQMAGAVDQYAGRAEED